MLIVVTTSSESAKRFAHASTSVRGFVSLGSPELAWQQQNMRHTTMCGFCLFGMWFRYFTHSLWIVFGPVMLLLICLNQRPRQPRGASLGARRSARRSCLLVLLHLGVASRGQAGTQPAAHAGDDHSITHSITPFWSDSNTTWHLETRFLSLLRQRTTSTERSSLYWTEMPCSMTQTPMWRMASKAPLKQSKNIHSLICPQLLL